MTRIRRAISVLAVAALLVSFPTITADASHRGDTPTAEEIINFSTGDPATDPGTEGIAVDRNGTIYVSANTAEGGQIWTIAPGATEPTVLTTLIPSPNGAGFGVLGLHFAGRDLLAAVHTLANPELNGVWRINPATGEATHLAGTEVIALPNDLTTWGRTIYVTDSAGGAVWAVKERRNRISVEPFLQDPLLEGLGVLVPGLPIGANGIAASRGRLYVANLEKGLIVEARIKRRSDRIQPRVYATVDGAPDGLEVDRWGRPHTVLVGQNELLRINRDGSSTALIDDAAILDAPASLTFGKGRDRSRIYVVNFSIGEGFPDAIEQSDVGPSVVAVSTPKRR